MNSLTVYLKINDYVLSFEYSSENASNFQLDIVEISDNVYEKTVLKTFNSSDFVVENNYIIIDVGVVNFSKKYSGVSVITFLETETYYYDVTSHEFYNQIREGFYGDEKDPYVSNNFKFMDLQEFHNLIEKTNEIVVTPTPNETPNINVTFSSHLESIDNNIQSLNISVLSLNIIVLFVLVLSIFRKFFRL